MWLLSSISNYEFIIAYFFKEEHFKIEYSLFLLVLLID